MFKPPAVPTQKIPCESVRMLYTRLLLRLPGRLGSWLYLAKCSRAGSNLSRPLPVPIHRDPSSAGERHNTSLSLRDCGSSGSCRNHVTAPVVRSSRSNPPLAVPSQNRPSRPSWMQVTASSLRARPGGSCVVNERIVLRAVFQAIRPLPNVPAQSMPPRSS